ncbi:MAG: O-antigen ligase family protein, partial [Actinomycetota bacterium]|nr:O-antigen ligase family protein [Actinomycetota bacterium]
AGVALLLLLLLATRVMAVGRPAEGLNANVALAVAGLVLLALWSLLSSRWSETPGRALVEFDRVLLYALALAVFGAVGMNSRRLRWMVRGIALAALVVCGSGLITRLLPDVWPLLQSQLPPPRLSYPVAYHNTLGLLAAIGITICIGLTSSERETRLVRVFAATATPLLASALVLSLSRGGVATAVLGVLVFAAVGHPRGLLAGLLAAGPAMAIAIFSTYDADLLVSLDSLSAAAQAQGRHVAAVVALCSVGAGVLRALLLYVDDVVLQLRPSAAVRRQVLGVGATVLAVVVVAGAVAVDAPGKYEDFVSPSASNTSSATSDETALARARLTSITDNGRIRYWTVAIDEFQRNVLHGTGAGTYPNSWAVHRYPAPGARPELVRDAHSLYAEILGELGIVGLVLLLTTLLTILVGLARRIRGPDRALFATIFAAIVAWAVAAGFDWHWEMPVVTMWVFALGGAAIAGARDRTPATRFLGMLPRSVIAIACLVLLALVPLRVMISDNRLQSTRVAFQERRCTEVSLFARQSLDAVASRAEPRQFAAGCELGTGDAQAAISTLRAAVKSDPDNWRVHYSLAIARARAGEDPRPQIRRARQLNPLEPLVKRVAKVLRRADNRREWQRAARSPGLRYVVPPL